MTLALAMVDCPHCAAPLPAYARYCGDCGNPLSRSAEITTQPSTTRFAALEQAQTAFHQRYPVFASTQVLDDLRATDYARLDQQGQIYLDYTGGGLYAESQLRAHLPRDAQRDERPQQGGSASTPWACHRFPRRQGTRPPSPVMQLAPEYLTFVH